MTKFCQKCKVETERNKAGKCNVCKKLYNAAYRADNRIALNADSANWRISNKEYYIKYRDINRAKQNSTNTEWRLANSEYHSEWRKANKEKIKITAQRYHAVNKEKISIRHSAWASSNSDVCRVYAHNRRAKKKTNGGKLSKGVAENLLRMQRGKCACCGKPLGDDYHLDHRMPLALGGANEDSNMQLLTSKCNQQKHAKHPIDFMQSRGFLL